MKINTQKQQLENYSDKYTNYDKWLKKETSHYVFHYLLASQAEKEVKCISLRQEKAFTKIVSFLGINPPKKKIKYYLYPNPKIKADLMGDGGVAQAIWHDNSIHVVYTDKIKPIGEHEDTHLLSLSWGVTISFLQEGLAEYMAGNRRWNGKSQLFWLKDGIKKNIIPPH